MKKKYILGIDQGTTGTTVIIFNKRGEIVSRAYQEFTQYFPKPGWVEHNPEEIWQITVETIKSALRKRKIESSEIAAIGITNQRETTVLWNKKTGKPVYYAIVWQCRRTAPLCDELKANGYEREIQKRTGLVIDAYFSATKLKWLLDKVKGAHRKAEKGELLFGTIDTWLAWKLSGGMIHATDYSNASRTMLFNIKSLKWDQWILDLLEIPSQVLPEVLPSSKIYGYTSDTSFLGKGIPISGMVGDQQGALFGQACFESGMVKNTYGTGSFIIINTGPEPIASKKGLLTSIAWGIDNKITYALEGSIFITGAGVQWLRDGLEIIKDSPESEVLARKVPDTEGVYIVPAFVGLGAPYWDMKARGTVVGITRGTKREHLARAMLEAIAYQTKDVIEVMGKESGINLKVLKVDGGAARNNFLMQFQSDILRINVERPEIIETTAQGASFLAGLAVGFWDSLDEIKEIRKIDKTFSPQMKLSQAKTLYNNWLRAVERAKNWIE